MAQPSLSSSPAPGVRPAQPAPGSGQDTPGNGYRKTGREVAAGHGQGQGFPAPPLSTLDTPTFPIGGSPAGW